jgi:hypothetical protein
MGDKYFAGKKRLEICKKFDSKKAGNKMMKSSKNIHRIFAFFGPYRVIGNCDIDFFIFRHCF